MAHNSGFYPVQGQPAPVFQQPQNIYQQLGKPQPQPHLQGFSPQSQQPPQGYGYSQHSPQAQQYAQQPVGQQYPPSQSPYPPAQTPYPPSQTPYPPSQTPYIPPQTPYSQPQVPYGAPQTQYAGYAPQPSPQPSYNPPHHQQPSPQMFQAPVQPVQSQPHVPATSYAVPQLKTPIPGSTGSSWRPTSSTSRPPPISPSAVLAQQVRSNPQAQQSQAQIQPVILSSPSRSQPQPQFQQQPQQQQHQQMMRQPSQLQASPVHQIRQQPLQQSQPQPQASQPQPSPTRQFPASQAPPTPTSSGRRPLPQPAPGMVTKPPVIPAGNVMQRVQNMNKSQSVDLGKPFPNPPSESRNSTLSMTRSPSPTKGRPLPGTPGNAASKRMTVDLGNLPSSLPASSASAMSGRASAASTAPMSREISQPRAQSGFSSPTKSVSGLPMPPSMAQNATNSNPGISKTSSYAIDANKAPAASNTSAFPSTSTSPTKRRPSPPRFQSQPNSASGSPTKESPAWTNSDYNTQNTPMHDSNNNANAPSSTFSTGPKSISGFSANSVSSHNTSSTMSTSSTTSSGAPRKFTPMWKRTIQEVPAPVWGYAAGMVSDPHPKPKPAPPPVHPVIADKKTKEEKKREKELEKDRIKLEKLSKKLGIATPAIPVPASPSGGAKPSMYSQQPQPAPQPAPQPYATPGSSPQKPAPPQHPQHPYQLPPLSFENRQQQPRVQQQPYPMQPSPHSAYARQHNPYQEEEEETEEDEEETEEDEEETGNDDEETEETEETEEEEDPRYARRAQRAQMRRTQSQPDEYEHERSTPIKAHQASASEFSQRTPTRHPVQKVHQLKGKGKEVEYFDKRSHRAKELKPSPQRKLIKLRPKNRDTEVESASSFAKRSMGNARPSRDDFEVSKKKHARSKSAIGEREISRRAEKVPYKRPGSAFARRDSYDDDDDDYSTEHRLAYDESDDEEDDDWDVTPRRNPGAHRQQGGSGGVRRIRDREEEEPVRDKGAKRLAKPKEHRRQASSPQYGIRNMPQAPSHRRGGSAPGSPGMMYDDEQDEPEYEDPQPSRRVRPDPGRRQTNTSGTGLPQPPSMVREAGGMQQTRQVAGRRTTAPLKGGSDYEEEYNQPRAQPPALPQRHSMGQQNFSQGVTPMTAKFSNMSVAPDPRSDSRGSTGTDMSGTTAYSQPADPWPVNLPRLPRTPGSANTPSGSHPGNDYFNSRPNTAQTSSSSFQGNNQQGQRVMQNPGPPLPPRGAQNTRRHTLNLDDPPPQASVIRTPSPGPSGYTFKENPQMARQQQQHSQTHQYAQQEQHQRSRPLPQHTFNGPNRPATAAEQLQRRRSLYNGSQPDMRPRPQSQSYDSPPSHQTYNQPPMSPQNTSNFGDQFNMQVPQGFNTARKQPQTPAPPPTIGIESPHPIGGRDKKPDIPMMEESSNDGSDTEDRRRRHDTSTPTIHINGDSGGHSIPTINIGEEQEPAHRMRGNAGPIINVTPSINVESGDNNVPMININPPSINVESSQPPQHGNRSSGVGNNNNSRTPRIQVFDIPGVSVAGPEFEDDHSRGPNINVSSRAAGPEHSHRGHSQHTHGQPRSGKGGLLCAGCNGPIVGRLVSAMGSRWHPSCFRCTVCNELLEHVSSYEHEGRPYCHLDYHENFAPRCYSCKTAIIEEQFISLDDPALGKRTYHTQHFYCAECGDPFLSLSGGLQSSSNGEMAVTGDGEFEGFTVYKGYPYCEACHIRLRYPKCKGCRRPIRDHDQAVEALGGKWCWGCFTCAGCEKPFEEPSFFERDNQAYCEHCFSVILRNEL